MNHHPWIEIVSDLITNALDVLTPDEVHEIFEDLEATYPELPEGSLSELLYEFETLPVFTRIAPAFDEMSFVMKWAKQRGIPVTS